MEAADFLQRAECGSGGAANFRVAVLAELGQLWRPRLGVLAECRHAVHHPEPAAQPRENPRAPPVTIHATGRVMRLSSRNCEAAAAAAAAAAAR